MSLMMLVLGSGGHTSELLKIISNLPENLREPSKHLLVYSSNDTLSLAKYKATFSGAPAAIKQIPRARNVGQSYFTSLFTTIYSFIMTLTIFLRFKPKLIICNGPAICVTTCAASYFISFVTFGAIKRSSIIYIESVARSKSLSLSGKIMLHLADDFLIQWPELADSVNKGLLFGPRKGQTTPLIMPFSSLTEYLFQCFPRKKNPLGCLVCNEEVKHFSKTGYCLSRCAHFYHKECLKKVAQKKGTCPECFGIISDNYYTESSLLIERIAQRDFKGINSREINFIFKFEVVDNPNFPFDPFFDHLNLIQWDFRQNDYELKRLLAKFCKEGDENRVKWLVEKYKVDAMAPTTFSDSTMNCFYESGHLSIVKYLFDSSRMKIDVDSCILAIRNRRQDILEYLLSKRPELLNMSDKIGVTCLARAVVSCETEIVEYLLGLGADPNVCVPREIYVRYYEDMNPLHSACESGAAEIVRLLLKYGADPMRKTESGRTVLHYACYCTNIDVIKVILEQGVPVNSVTEDFETPLHCASIENDPEILALLIENGADVNAIDCEGFTPLLRATYLGMNDNFEVYLNAGADVNQANNKGYTALHYLVRSSYLSANNIFNLIQLGADVNARTVTGETPLNFAYKRGDQDMIDVLLKHGADPKAANSK